MKNQILNKLNISDREKQNFEILKNNYNITDKLFYKNNILYTIKIIYKNDNIFYQLKQNKEIILESKNKKTIENKIMKILEVK